MSNGNTFSIDANLALRYFNINLVKTSTSVTVTIANQSITSAAEALITKKGYATTSVTESVTTKLLSAMTNYLDVPLIINAKGNSSVTGGYQVLAQILTQRQNTDVTSGQFLQLQSVGLNQNSLFFWTLRSGSHLAKYWVGQDGGTYWSNSYASVYVITDSNSQGKTSGKKATFTLRLSKTDLENVSNGTYWFSGVLYLEPYVSQTQTEKNALLQYQINIRDNLIHQIDQRLLGNNNPYPVNSEGIASLKANKATLQSQIEDIEKFIQ